MRFDGFSDRVELCMLCRDVQMTRIGSTDSALSGNLRHREASSYVDSFPTSMHAEDDSSKNK